MTLQVEEAVSNAVVIPLVVIDGKVSVYVHEHAGEVHTASSDVFRKTMTVPVVPPAFGVLRSESTLHVI